MAYMSQEKKKEIGAMIKPLLKRYGLKGSLAVRNHSTLVLNIKSGKIDFGGDRVQVNHYWIQDHYTGRAREFLTKAKDIMMGSGYYDHSDAQIDYFNCAWYIDINVGKWNKPYELTR